MTGRNTQWDTPLLEPMLRAAENFPDDPLVYPGGGAAPLTYREVRLAAEQLAAALADLGVAPRVPVAAVLPNTADFVVVQLALLMSDAVTVLIPPMLSVDEIEYFCRAADVKHVLLPAEWSNRDFVAIKNDLANRLREDLRSVSTIRDLQLEATESLGGGGGDDVVSGYPDEVDVLFFSSGSVSTPKPIMHSSETLLAHVSWLFLDELGYGRGEVIYTACPVTHLIGWWASALSWLSGGAVSYDDRWNARKAIGSMRDSGSTRFHGVPTQVIDLLREIRDGGAEIPKLTSIWVSGAPLDAAVIAAVEQVFGFFPCQGYGSTEVGAAAVNLPWFPIEKHLNTVGKPIPGADVTFLGSESRGEVVARTAGTSPGYYTNQPGVREAVRSAYTDDGRFRTGDLGEFDADGYLVITGRLRDTIIRGGENIEPADVENLIRHNVVELASSRFVVVPSPDERLGEQVCVVVEATSPDTVVSLESLRSALASAGVPRYKVPERLVVLPQLPLTHSEKIDRRGVTSLVADLDPASSVAGSPK
jgi:acyl-CoA synthetase (AMP-forming)/AMP-acid ligase II